MRRIEIGGQRGCDRWAAICSKLKRRSLALLCGLVLLGGLAHQALMVSPWHQMVMGTAAEVPLAAGMAMGDGSPPPAPDEHRVPMPVSGDCPARQVVPLPCVALPYIASFVSATVVASPVASAESRPRAFPSFLPAGQRRAPLQIYLI